ncbi:MAG TPA: hypothetical protein VID48_08650 [Solirubrobacteraceae bacterium]|jgi:DNA-binding PadR family transcriptional regulator
MSAMKNAVLGLVIERPSERYRLAVDVRDRFGAGTTYVYWALDQLEGAGLVDRFDDRGHPVRRGVRCQRPTYRPTEQGIAHFDQWLSSSISEPSFRSDEVHIRLGLCRPRDVPGMIDQVLGQEQVCLGRIRDLKRLGEEQPPLGSSWSKTVEVLSRDAELAHWSSRLEWLQSVRGMLDRIPRDASVR